jgi:VanZ family protein
MSLQPAELSRAPSPTRWIWVVLWMAFIFFMSAQSQSGEQSQFVTLVLYHLVGGNPSADQLAVANHLLRKTAHFTVYAVLATLSWWALPGRGLKRLAIAWLIAALYACTDELHQMFVPSRGPAITDVGIDSCGALTALVLVHLGTRKR